MTMTLDLYMYLRIEQLPIQQAEEMMKAQVEAGHKHVHQGLQKVEDKVS